VERELVEDLSFSVTAIGKWEKNIIDDIDTAHLSLETLRNTGNLVWTGYHPVFVSLSGVIPMNDANRGQR